MLPSRANSDYDPLDPYDSYRFKDQASKISETSIANSRLVSDKKSNVFKIFLILLAILIIIGGASFYFLTR
jgi:hypothetical protein